MTETLHPQTRAALARAVELGARPLETLTPQEARTELARFAALRPRVTGACEVRDLSMTTHAGIVPGRLYRPATSPANPPVVLYFHGGGHVVGSIEVSDDIARRTALRTGAAVVSVGYRKGPEHRFPAAVEDAYAALEWVVAHAAELRIDGSRVAVMGESAGANLATVAALRARDEGGPRIATQVLVYPVADYRLRSTSFDTYARGYGILSSDAMRWFRSHYLAEVADAEDWRASPILAPSLAALPPALVIGAGCDPLIDDVRAYAQRLADEGVPTELVVYPGVVHGFFSMPHAIDMARDANEAVARHLGTFFPN